MSSVRQVPHDRAELRSPLPPPSAAARRFMPSDPDPYPAEAYIQPTDALEKSAALAAAQREADALADDMPDELNTSTEPPRAPGGTHG